jgi:hypothetical protein
MNNLDRDLDEIFQFIKALKFSSKISAAELALIKSAYKQFHSLLIWGIVGEKEPNSPLPIRTYCREGLSDCSHAFFLTLLDLYKPARGSLRGAVENFLRLSLMYGGVDPTEETRVYELWRLGKKNFASVAGATDAIQHLEVLYSELCKTVHASKINYMSLAVPFETLSEFHAGRFKSNFTLMKSVYARENQLLFLIKHRALRLVGHKNEDFVRDALPPTIKRAALDAPAT